MAADTATIRVTRRTRDLLAAQARARGISLASMLEELALDREREALFRSERDATRADAANPSARAEDDLWDATVGDGVD